MSTKKPTPSSGQSGRRRHSAEFKLEAIDLARDIGFKQAAADLGVHQSQLRRWSEQVTTRGRGAFLSPAERTDLEAEVARLRAENRTLKTERDILKKAATYFAKESR